jgi:hypothetical protein
MNSEALKVAWLSTWNTAATAASGEPRPIRKTIRPRWLTVEYASSPLRSCLKIAMKAANSTVTRPAAVTMISKWPVPASTGYMRMSRNTPALTMVAECRYADTGVGAAMASGNQKWNGNCALLVNAPTRISSKAGTNLGSA